MNTTTSSLLFWIPRAAGILVALFLGAFALDAFDGRSFVEGLPFFLVHLTPTFLVLAVVAISWRFEWVGAVAFLALALAYATMVNWRPDWVAAISGPLAVVGMLFLVSWRYHTAGHPGRP